MLIVAPRLIRQGAYVQQKSLDLMIPHAFFVDWLLRKDAGQRWVASSTKWIIGGLSMNMVSINTWCLSRSFSGPTVSPSIWGLKADSLHILHSSSILSTDLEMFKSRLDPFARRRRISKRLRMNVRTCVKVFSAPSRCKREKSDVSVFFGGIRSEFLFLSGIVLVLSWLVALE